METDTGTAKQARPPNDESEIRSTVTRCHTPSTPAFPDMPSCRTEQSHVGVDQRTAPRATLSLLTVDDSVTRTRSTAPLTPRWAGMGPPQTIDSRTATVEWAEQLWQACSSRGRRRRVEL